MPRLLSHIVFFLLIPLLLATPGVCDTVNIGLISFDVLIPGSTTPGVNVFDISNFTGDPLLAGFALPPDFPVLDFLTFLSSSLTLTGSGSPLVIPLGDLGPGALSPTDPVQFPDTSVFTGAVFTATLSQTSFLLADGSTFVAGSPAISATVLPSSGPSLVAGTDFAVLTVSSLSNIPEPNNALLLGAFLAILIGVNRRKAHA